MPKKSKKPAGDFDFDVKGFQNLTKMTHTEQAIWYLNGFWNDGGEENAEMIWEACHYMMELQMGRKILYGSRQKEDPDDVKEKNDIDQFQAHRFLEHFGETKTASQLRTELKTIDLDKDNRLCLTEYLISRFGKTPKQVINAPQGGESKGLAEAEEKMNQISAQLDVLQVKLQEQEKAVAELKVQQEAADAALASASAADAKLQAAKDEAQAAKDELDAQQAAYDAKCAKLQGVIDDEKKSNMKKNKARNELAQLKSEDPLPLSRARITQAAALKKVKKEAKKAAKAKALAEEAAAAAETARLAGEAAAAEVAAAVEETNRLMEEAAAEFERLKKIGDGVQHGKIFFMERKMKEIKKYMPKGRKKRKA